MNFGEHVASESYSFYTKYIHFKKREKESKKKSSTFNHK